MKAAEKVGQKGGDRFSGAGKWRLKRVDTLQKAGRERVARREGPPQQKKRNKHTKQKKTPKQQHTQDQKKSISR